MARIEKALVAQDDVIEIEAPRGDPGSIGNGTCGIQYDAFGNDGVTAAAGTVVFETTINGVEWYPSKINMNDETVVDDITAPGLGWVELSSFVRARARLSVASGAHGVKVWLNYLTP